MKALACLVFGHRWSQSVLRTEGVFVILTVHCLRCRKKQV